MAQYYGKESDVNIKIPKSVKRDAMLSYELKNIGFKGGKKTGWKRAKQLSTKETIPVEDLRYMRNWFARHVITSYPTYKAWKDAGSSIDSSWHNKRGVVSWLIWGGDPAFKWVNSDKNISLLNRIYGTSYEKITLTSKN